jgi:hypothetical protein
MGNTEETCLELVVQIWDDKFKIYFNSIGVDYESHIWMQWGAYWDTSNILFNVKSFMSLGVKYRYMGTWRAPKFLDRLKWKFKMKQRKGKESRHVL